MEKNSTIKESLEKQLNLEVLDEPRTALLPLLKQFKEDFYLAGGTALALQIGHRTSEDFDYFSLGNFDITQLQQKTYDIFKYHKITVVQLESDTYTIFIDNSIKISFFDIEAKLKLPPLKSEWFQLCSEVEIGAMKIAALMRAAYKDYVDLHFIMQNYKFENILELCAEKYPHFEKTVYLKALFSFEDIEITPIQYLMGKEKPAKEIFSFIKNQVEIFLRNYR